jgi:putative DNA methylase
MEVKTRKKLIEVALPLDAINAACAHEKMPGIGPHPRGIHLWWARRPLAAARSVIFSQMVDDPSTYVDELLKDSKLKAKAEGILRTRLKRWEDAVALAKKAEAAKIKAPPPGEKPTLGEVIAEIERDRIFRLIEQLVEWENTTNEEVLKKAREEIWNSWRRTCEDNANHPKAKELFDPKKLPAFHDPFAGGGALPLEAQRLGLEAHASDLNPVAVLINKSMIEIPPKFAGKPPVNPEARSDKELIGKEWRGAEGLAEDIRYYGQWIRDEAEKRIGHLYPKIEITKEMAKTRMDLKPYAGRQLPVIAWIWSRTVKSPNPAFRKIDVPLASTFMLSTKVGKEAYIEPVIAKSGYHFIVKVGKPKDVDAVSSGTSAGKRAAFKCVMSETPIPYDYIRTEGQAGRMGARLMAVVAEGDRGRVYLAPTLEHEAVAQKVKTEWKPDVALPVNPRNFNTPNYGLSTYGDLFTSRQLVALTHLSDLIQQAREQVKRNAIQAGLPDDGKPLHDGGTGAKSFAEAVSLYLAFAVDRCSDFSNSATRWVPGNQKVMNLFGKQAIAMTWDFPEAAILHETVGGFVPASLFIAECIKKIPQTGLGKAHQVDASSQNISSNKIVSTDPP